MLDFTLYLITDRSATTAGRDLPAVVADALAGGVRAVQLREKDLSSRQLLDLALTLRHLTRTHCSRLLINDRIDIALASGADGVHIGAGSIPVIDARRLLGPEALIGYSAHSVAEALQAEKEGASFVTFGPVYPTPSKACYGKPLGLAKLADAAHSLTIPVFALGGIKQPSIAATMTTGCHGVAVISAIISAEKPEDAASSIITILNRAS
ncbi:thiamine phosphate synthase [Pelotalea chapellei]|uniref:Thiamine-phosphate synthase n=1 Tax=Pelotalea chapellei TaxID=44671 RepID=A0ABS5UC98_9BACT|nr:thiamine phosphate synthase [Pelotalea chapellei]MBT1073273.1 thiamine phosphate synthase [Pelotalea chapellei]